MASETDKKIEILFVSFLIIIGIYYIYLASMTQMLGEDEDTYFSLAREFSKGNMELVSYHGAPRIIPLFMSLTYSFFFLIFGYSLSVAKSIIALYALLTLLIVYLLGKKFNIYLGFFSALLLISISNFSHSSMLAYVETPIAFFSALITYLLLTLGSDRFILKSFVIGVILGISYHTKFSGLVLSVILFLYCMSLYLYKRNKKYIKLFLFSLIGFSVMIAPYIIRNLLVFQYPFFQGLNLFFKYPLYVGPTVNIQWVIEATKLISPPSVSIDAYISTFNYFTFIFSIFGISYFLSNFKTNLKESHFLFLLILPSVLFLILFNLSSITAIIITESRYLSIIFPQMSILAGFFLWKIKEKNKYLLIFLMPIIVFAIFSGVTVAQGTSVSQRYPNDYVEALGWLKDNTPEDSMIFTAYGGSVDYFAERRTIWTIKEFPDMMSTNNGTYIHEILKVKYKEYNITHILVWNGILAQNYIVPQSNLIGAFTYNFLNVVSADTENFEIVFQNQNNIIFELK